MRANGDAYNGTYDSRQEENNRRIIVVSPTRRTGTLDVSAKIVIGLTVVVLILSVVVIVVYWFKYKKSKKVYTRLKSALHNKPKLKISLPDLSASEQSPKQHAVITKPKTPMDSYRLTKPQEGDQYVPPVTPNTPLSPTTPGISASSSGTSSIPQKYSLSRSISTPVESLYAEHNDRVKDVLWRNAVKKATATQFLKTEPKSIKRISYCADGKVKFSLEYNIKGQKELTVTILDFIDLPLSRETGISIPFVKVYLYPQNVHSYPEVSKGSGFRVEVLSFPRDTSCTFTGCPIDKLCSSAMKFVILDYDRFSRSEYVADCVVMMDEVSLEGEAISKHLSIRKTQTEKDMGSLLISLCYQPNTFRMCIIVLKASGLPEADGGHFPDHFVKISLLRNNLVLDKRRTRVIKKSICPVFNESLVFPIDNQSIRNVVFVFELIRHDSKLKQEKIASVVLGNHSNTRQVTPHEIQHFNEMLQTPQRQIAEWHKLVS